MDGLRIATIRSTIPVALSLAGRRTYDNSIKWWGANGLGGRPTIIVSHDVPAHAPGDGVYTFVGGVRAALGTARALVGDKDIQVMGGNITGQFLHEGLVDEIAIHLIPILFGTVFRCSAKDLHRSANTSDSSKSR